MHTIIKAGARPANVRLPLAVATAVLLGLVVFSCGGNRDDGVHRSEDGVLLPEGQDFDDDRRRR